MSMKSRVANQRPLVTLQSAQWVFAPNLILPTWTQCSCTPSNLVTSPPAWTGDETTAARSKKAKAMRIMISQDYWFGTTLALLQCECCSEPIILGDHDAHRFRFLAACRSCLVAGPCRWRRDQVRGGAGALRPGGQDQVRPEHPLDELQRDQRTLVCDPRFLGPLSGPVLSR